MIKKIAIIILVMSYLPLWASANFQRGKTAYIYRNYDKAKEYFLKDIEQYDRGDSYYFMGEIEKILKNYKSAFEYYEKAVTKSMTKKYMVNAYWNLIVLTEERNDYGKVVHYCREMWRKTRDGSARSKVESLINKMLWTSNQSAIEKYKNGLEQSKRGKKAEAHALFLEASAIDSSFLAPKFELGMHAYNNNNEAEAMRYLSEIAYRIPYYAEIQLILGDLNYKNGNYSAAAENFDAVIEYGFIDQGLIFKTLVKRGESYYRSGNYISAEKDFVEVTKSKTRDTNTYLLLSAIYIKQSKFDEALNTLKIADKMAPDEPSVLFQMGSIYYHKQDWKYISYFDRLFEKVQNESHEKMRLYDRAFKILIKSLFEKEKYSRTITVASKISEYSNDYDTMLVLAKSHYFVKNYDKSIEYFEKISPSNLDKVTLAKAYFYSSRKSQASVVLKDMMYDTAALSEARKDNNLKKIINELNSGSAGQKNSGGSLNGTKAQ